MEIDGNTKVLGVFGNPIRHTLSPEIHNTLAKLLKMNLVYVPFHVTGSVENAVKGAWDAGVEGLNITVPFKQAVIPCVTQLDPVAGEIGAVNTLVREKDGFSGHNTDMPGLKRALDQLNVSLSGKSAVVLGAGGAARAVICMLLHEGAGDIYLVNRTLSHARQIANMDARIHPVTPDEACEAIPRKRKYLFFQCTSLGLKEGEGLLVSDSALYDLAEFGFDLIYNPPVTPFLRLLQEKGIPCSNGLGMLLYQGVIAFEKWNRISVPEDIVRQCGLSLRRKLYGNNLVLVGYMGAGKTSVGKKLAERTGRQFLDADVCLEKKTGKSIPDIFREKGEKGFREMETSVLKELSESLYNTVLATGGGAVLKKENIACLKATGPVIYLSASPAESFRRLKNDTGRPLLQTESGNPVELMERITKMTQERTPWYLAAADTEVMTDGKKVADIAEEITRRFP